MSHPRKVVRDAFVAVVTGLPLTGSRVHTQPRRAITALPALRIATTGDVPEEVLVSDRALPSTRQVSLVCEALVQSGTQVADDLDAICDQVEQAVDANFLLNGAVHGTRYDGADLEDDTVGDQPVMVARMRFLVSV